MLVFKIIFLVVVVGLTLWLLIDTAIMLVKKIKAKKQSNKNDEVENNDNQS